MIGFLKGILFNIERDTVIIDVNGVGYEVNIPTSTLNKLPLLGNEIIFHTYLDIKENQMQLFGFLNREEKNVFNLLIEVNGIGPKSALGIISAISVESLLTAIIQEDIGNLTKLPGIGKKTAQRLIIELKDKLQKNNLIKSITLNKDNRLIDNNIYNDSIEALSNLGYNQKEVEPILQSILKKSNEELTIDNLIKYALKELAFK